jgi:hypothetical protein
LYKLDDLKNNKELWKGLEFIPVSCSWCNGEFEIKYGTLYNVVRRNADGIYCSRKCAGSGRANGTQEKYQKDGGKRCKRCGEFKSLDNFSKLPNPPYLRSECKRCHNFKPARSFTIYKDKASRDKVNFNIGMDDFVEFWNKDCFYCSGKVKKIRIELLDMSKGFVSQNIVSCCRQCQKLKGEFSHIEFLDLCQKITDNIRKLEEK